jgi:hypothetical protein
MRSLLLTHVRRAALLLVCSVCLVLGCGGGPEVGSVSGRVTLDGEPLADARVNFQPIGGSGRNAGIGSYGRTNANGEYSLTLIDDSGQGAVVGMHKVMIKAVPEPKGGPNDDKARSGPDRVPREYNIDSTLTFEVKPGPNTADWPLKSKKKQ